MKKMAITEWGGPLQWVSEPDPQPQGAQVLVRTQACGVCHSDVHVWEGFFDFGVKGKVRFADRGAKLPFTLGHEIVGTVVAKGPDAKGVEIGKSYIVYPWIGCGQCAACARGDELMCMQMRSLGLRCDGGYADHVLVHDARYLVDYGALSAPLAATYACSGITAYSALKKALPLNGADWLCIIGAGGVGGSAIGMARAMTDVKILVCDIDPAKREAALKAGAHQVVDSSAADAAAQVASITGGGPAAVVDFVGAGATMSFAIDIARRGGTVVIVGLFGGSAPIAPLAITTKVLTVRGSFVGTLDDLREVVALAQKGALPAIPLTSITPEEATGALEALKTGGKVVGRMVMTFS